MFTKKLKKIGRVCRVTGDPVLLTLATYLNHVVNCIELAAEDDATVMEYRNALAQLDLSAVVKAREALAVAKPTTQPATEEVAEHRTKGEKKDKKRKEKKEKTDEGTVMTAPSIAQDAGESPESVIERSNGKKKKGKKKAKKKSK